MYAHTYTCLLLRDGEGLGRHQPCSASKSDRTFVWPLNHDIPSEPSPSDCIHVCVCVSVSVRSIGCSAKRKELLDLLYKKKID